MNEAVEFGESRIRRIRREKNSGIRRAKKIKVFKRIRKIAIITRIQVIKSIRGNIKLKRIDEITRTSRI